MVTGELGSEHQAVLGELGRLADAMIRYGRGDREGLERLRQVRDFLNRELERHLRKEEEGLFPVLEGRIGREGPISAMLHEHEELRRLVRLFGEELASEYPHGGELARITRELGDLLSAHILKEDQVLFPLAERSLSPAEAERVRRNMAESAG